MATLDSFYCAALPTRSQRWTSSAVYLALMLAVFAFLSATLSQPVYARDEGVKLRDDRFGYEEGDIERIRDLPVTLPALPEEDALVELDSDEIHNRHRFFLDIKSLEVKPGGLYRYTIVLLTAKGAQNLFYEGIFCPQNEHIRYGYAFRSNSRTGTFKQQRNSRWKEIARDGVNGYQSYLADQILCGDGTGASEQQIKRILSGLEAPGGIFRSPVSGE